MRQGPKRRRFAVASSIAAIGAACLLAACGSDSDSGGSAAGASTTTTAAAPKTTKPIVIGAAIAKSGFIAAYDGPSFESLELKIDQINAAGGIAGRQLKVIVSDTKSEIARGGQAAESVMSQGADIVIVSCDFDFGSPAALAAQKAGKVSISLCASSPKFGAQAIGDKAFSLQPSVGDTASVLAAFATKQGYKNGYVLLDDTLSYTKGIASSFEKFYGADGGKLAGKDTFKNADNSIAAQINTLKAKKPDFIFMASYPPGGASAIRQLRAAGVDVPILGGDAFDGTYWVKAVPGLKDFYIATVASAFGDDPNPVVNKWYADYKAKYGAAPTKGQSAVGYAIGQSLEKALTITKGDPEGAGLAKALESFKAVPLVVGATTFDAQTHIPIQNSQAILQYTDGKPKYLETVAPTGKVLITDGAG